MVARIRDCRQQYQSNEKKYDGIGIDMTYDQQENDHHTRPAYSLKIPTGKTLFIS